MKVTNKTVRNDVITYTLVDGITPVGWISYYLKRSCWRAQGIDGLLINDQSMRREMYKAVRQFDAALFLP
jgi:hypothetical protein